MDDELESAAEMLEKLTRDPMTGAWSGAVRVLSIGAPAKRGRFQETAVELGLEAEGLAPETVSLEVVFDTRHWPEVGAVVPARISRGLPRQVEPDWDALAG